MTVINKTQDRNFGWKSKEKLFKIKIVPFIEIK